MSPIHSPLLTLALLFFKFRQARQDQCLCPGYCFCLECSSSKYPYDLLPQFFEVFTQKAPSHGSLPWLLFLKFQPIPLTFYILLLAFCFSVLSPSNIFYILLIYLIIYLSPRKHTPYGPGFLSLFTDYIN